MTTNNSPCSEAPASWNTRYVTPEGFECQITLRADTGQEVLEKAQGAIAFLLKSGCAPCWNGKHINHEQPQYTDQVTVPDGNGNNGHERGWCPIHQSEMKRWDKDGRTWYSHKVGDQWCSGKVKTR